MKSRLRKASEAGDPVPASGESHAALVANRRRGADDARIPGASSVVQWDPVPVRIAQPLNIQASIDAAISCPRCSSKGLYICCLGAKQLDEHFQREHPEVQANWLCQCGKSFPKQHAWRCHYPKCKGTVDNPLATHKCSSCPMAFETKIGLGQHERHAHPSVRNTKRAAEAERPPDKGGRRLTVWTEEELKELYRLNAEFQGAKNINIKLMEFFPGKTNKQISDARRRLKSPTPITPPAEPVAEALPSPAASICCSANMPEPQAITENTARESVAEVATSDDLQWKDDIVFELRKPHEIPNTWADVAAKMVTYIGRELTNEEIDSLQDDLVGRKK